MKTLKLIINKYLLIAAGCVLYISAIPVKNSCVLSKDFSVTINGTSNLHAWEENVEIVTGDASINPNANGTFDLNAITISMDVHSIKSKEGSVMNNKTYKSLKGDKHPKIIFTLTEKLKSIPGVSNKEIISASGLLSIAGVTKPVNMQVRILLDQGTMSFEGKQTVKMSDYDISPPTALFGMLKTGNEIVINYKTNFALCD